MEIFLWLTFSRVAVLQHPNNFAYLGIEKAEVIELHLKHCFFFESQYSVVF